jgi:hypothetical protein
MKNTLFSVMLTMVMCISFAEAFIRSDVLKKDSATLSSAYFDGYYTNKSLLNFNLEVLRASNKGLKCLENEKLWIRIALGVFLYELNYQAFVAFHEDGHALRWKAFGFDYVFYNSAEGTGQEEKNIFVYYFKKMTFQGGSGGSTGVIIPEKYINKIFYSLKDKSDYNIIVSAGGLNNETLLAESIGYDMYVKKEVSWLSWFVYLTERFSGVSYDNIAKDDELGDDPTAIINAFNEKGRKDFKRGGN